MTTKNLNKQKSNLLRNDEDMDDAEIMNDDEDIGYDPIEPDVYEVEFGDDIETAEEALKRKKETLKRERRARRVKNKTSYYVDPELMTERIKEFYASDGDMSPELASDIRKITERLCLMPKFINYTFRDEMAADAFLKAYMVIYNKKFKVELGYNPFNYISKVAERACIARIMLERKEHQTIYDYRDEHYDQVKQENTGGDY